MWQPLNGEPPLPSWGIIPQPNEPAHRFFARLTALNGQDSARSLAHQMGLNGRRASGLLEFCLTLPIREKERLQASTASVAGSRVTLCGQTFAKFDWSVHMARVCPACLAESEHARNWWDLKVVFRCPFHDEPLIRESGGSVTRWWTKSPARFADGNPIGESGIVRGSSKTDANWEAYVLGRMRVSATVPTALLDDLASMADVVKAVEFVGRAAIAGYSDRRPTLRPTGAAREEIIRTGFAALSEGYEALRRIAARVADASPSPRSEIEKWGARKLFGWLGRSYESDHPIVPEFEKALRDEAHSRSIYQGWTKLPGYRPADTPLTMVELARLLSLSPATARKLTIDLGFAYKTSTRRTHLFTAGMVDQIREFKDSLLDRDGAAKLLGIDRGLFDALVHKGHVEQSYRFLTRGVLSDRFHPKRISDCEQPLCDQYGKSWRQSHTLRKDVVNSGPEAVAEGGDEPHPRFRKLPQAVGLAIHQAEAIIHVDRATALSMVDAGILLAIEGASKRLRLTHKSVERARNVYAPAQLYADCLPDPIKYNAAGDALASIGVPLLPLGPGTKAVVERAAARKALGLSKDPDQVRGSLLRFWRVVEDEVRSADLPFLSMQLPRPSTLILWDSSRLVRLAFAVVDNEFTLVGTATSGTNIGRRNGILPHIAGSLRVGHQRSSLEFKLDESGRQATLNEFCVRDEGNWPRAIRFVAEYLTYVRHGLYDARAQLRKAAR